MKPALAIVAAAIDIDASVARVLAALAGERDAVSAADKHERLGAAARETAKVRRLDTGHELIGIRGTWPPSGPKAKGWSEYLKRVGLDDSTAVRYMNDAKASLIHGGKPGEAPDRDSAHGPAREPNPRDEEDDQYGPNLDPLPDPDRATAAPFRALSETELVQAIARLDPDARKRIIGASKAGADDVAIDRDAWCTPKWLAEAIGEVDLDPCSNERTHIRARSTFRLDFGEDGLARAEGVHQASCVFINPPYSNVTPWIAAYGHTRFVFLLKLDPSTKWFQALIARTELVLIPRGTRVAFEPPPGVPPDKANANPFPHALFYAHATDATDAIRALCFAWHVDRPTDKQAAAPAPDAAATTH